ncbi:MAG: hypothetical protein CO158_01850 [Piscirickettsiaceae bacterium CG_4_9_14_3_um_filter_43_564]|nr:trimeric intracellular cation channel family protein [Thiomicrospira sp.]PIQ02568.1 MAG: hypothetical protein COW74_10840 [Piscirickettsiaceae bacterium CG18_big_fil_WC_8_21_14_2_50_44_103]PIU39565.1 MAG: hypothetical protein COT01_00805 [Piscirickettsiaceae bacterium CG07_land_8_20_14_0_80_44_28]PIW57566.1 MAG: hypothetical protein COW14_05275 [Piscirickettsiaceae bacterium CG12_big_fil_rev_8_21_14_0_65_44_934]PIW77850.1 MAG: hypothetical protein CO000_04745 [Piscirickettsiaceae bacterium C
MNLMQTLYFFDLLGTVVFAMTGLLAASRKQLDLFGAVVIAMVTAVGGGTLRDLILDQPVFWISQNIYLYVVVVSTLFLFFYARFKTIPIKFLLYLDALGLAVFSVIGAQKAMGLGLSDPIVIMTGVMTGVVGGVIRDVLMGEVPLIFRKEIYATASFIGISLLLILVGWNIPVDMAIIGSIGVIFTLRVWALVFNVGLPVFQPINPPD